MVKNHGYLIETDGFMTTPLPTLAPNMRRIKTFIFDGQGNGDRTKNSEVRYQKNRFTADPGRYSLLEKELRSVSIIEQILVSQSQFIKIYQGLCIGLDISVFGVVSFIGQVSKFIQKLRKLLAYKVEIKAEACAL